MVSGQTVINRFVEEVVAELQRRGADPVARRVYEVAAVLEPTDRGSRTDAEDRRLVLLADRAARRWVATTLRALPGSALVEIAAQQPAVRSAADAADAAARLRAIRAQLRRAPVSAGAAQPADIEAALAPVQKLLAAVGEGRTAAAEAQEARAIGWAARGLVACFYASGTFPDGLPGEVRATTTILDTLDDERAASWGAQPSERTAHESGTHTALVAMLVSTLATGKARSRARTVSGHCPSPIPSAGTGPMCSDACPTGRCSSARPSSAPS